MTTLDTLCSNLNFNYESLLLSSSDKKEYADARMAFHHSIESIRNQALFSVILMRQLLAKLRPENADPNIALLLPDIFPESSESLCSVILEALLRAPGLTRAQHISVLSRRGEKLHDKLPKAFEHIKMHWDWSSTQLLSSFDVVIVVCSAMHFPLTQELILNQISYSKTLFFVTTNGVTINRAKNMIKSSAVVIPCFDYQSELLGHRFDQQVCFNLLKPQPAQWKPDLDLLKQCLFNICTEYGQPNDITQQLIDKIVPKTIVDGLELFSKYAIPPFNYPSAVLDFSRNE